MRFVGVQTGRSRCVVAVAQSGRGAATRLAGVAPIATETSPERIAAAIRAVAGRGRIARLVVALGDESLRTRRLEIPPLPPEEMPAVVRLQVEREAGSGVVVDFAPSPVADQQVLAAWCDPPVLERWSEVARRLGASLHAVAPRALCASLATAGNERQVLACDAGDEWDFIATADGKPVLLRCVRTEADDAPAAEAAQRELRRTLLALAAGDGDPPWRVAHDGLLGAMGDTPPVAAVEVADAAELALDEGVNLRGALSAIGAAGIAASRRPLPIDLVHPHAGEATRKPILRTALLTGAAVLALAAGALGAYQRLAALDRQEAEYDRRRREALQAAEEFAPYVRRLAAIDAWSESDVNWLDELARLAEGVRPEPLAAEDFPVESDVRLTRLVATAATQAGARGGAIELTAAARSAATGPLEARLRDDERDFRAESTSGKAGEGEYRYSYKARWSVPPSPLEPQRVAFVPPATGGAEVLGERGAAETAPAADAASKQTPSPGSIDAEESDPESPPVSAALPGGATP